MLNDTIANYPAISRFLRVVIKLPRQRIPTLQKRKPILYLFVVEFQDLNFENYFSYNDWANFNT